MPAFLLYLPGLILAALWIRFRPVRTPAVAFRLWIIGVLAMRVLQGLSAMLLERQSGAITALPQLIGWAGAWLVLPAVWYLVHDGRAPSRRLRWFQVLFAVAFLLPMIRPGAGIAFLILAIPLLCSFRWRLRLGAGELFLVNAVALLSVLLGAIVFGTRFPEMRERLAGMSTFTDQVASLASIYALMSLPMTGSRIHLSIRRIGRRLFISHLLASVIPLVLSLVFLLLTGALHLSTYRSLIGARLLKARSEAARGLILSRLRAGESVPLRPFGEEAERQAVLWRAAAGSTRLAGDTLQAPAESVLALPESSEKVPLLWDGSRLWLRARIEAGPRAELHGDDGDRPVRIDAFAQVDSLGLARISGSVGQPIRIFPGIIVSTAGGGVQIGTEAERLNESDTLVTAGVADSAAVRRLMRRIGPPAPPGWRIPGGATLECAFWSEGGWSRRPIPIASTAGFGEQVGALFGLARENPFAIVVLIALAAIAFLFLGTIGVVSSMVVSMGRSILRAVQALTEGTHALQAGKLEHRIAVQGTDELWRVAESFNEMAEGLERIRAVEREQHRLEEELRLARAIQTRLLPAAPPQSDRIELAGLSLPAREVGGDYYDYLQLEDGSLGLAVADVSGKGTPAALLMSAFRASLRSQDLARIGPAEALGRINRFIHESVDPGKFITAFLAVIDPATGDVRYANAGHDAPIVLKADGTTEEMSGGGLILGMLPQIAYEEARSRLEPGSLMAVFTDGVTEARSVAGDFFGPEGLIQLLCETRGENCNGMLQRLVARIEEFAGGGPQSDDITVILARRK